VVVDNVEIFVEKFYFAQKWQKNLQFAVKMEKIPLKVEPLTAPIRPIWSYFFRILPTKSTLKECLSFGWLVVT
jgi:hypothetical protein